MNGGLGACWWQACDSEGIAVVTGVPVVPASKEAADAAARMRRLGLVVCEVHAPEARALAASTVVDLR